MSSNNNSQFKAPLPKGSRGRSVKKRGERRPAKKDRSRSQQRLEGPRGRGITRDAPGRKGDKSRSRSRAREEQSNPAPASRPTSPKPAPRSRPTTPTAAPASRPRMPTPPLPPSKPVPASGPSKQAPASGPSKPAPASGPSKQAPAPRSAMNIVIDEKSHKTRKEKDAHIAELKKVTEIKLKAAKDAEKREAAEAERREQAMKSKFGQGAYKAITNAEWRGLVAEEQDPIRKGLNPNEILHKQHEIARKQGEIERRQDEEQREHPKRVLSAKLKDEQLKRGLRRPVQSNKPTPAVRVAKEHEITRAAEAARIQAELNSRVYDEPSNNSKKIGMLKRMFPGKGSKKKKGKDSKKKKRN